MVNTSAKNKLFCFYSLFFLITAVDAYPGYGTAPSYRPFQNVKPYEAQVGLDPFPCNVPQTTQNYESHYPLGNFNKKKKKNASAL